MFLGHATPVALRVVESAEMEAEREVERVAEDQAQEESVVTEALVVDQVTEWQEMADPERLKKSLMQRWRTIGAARRRRTAQQNLQLLPLLSHRTMST